MARRRPTPPEVQPEPEIPERLRRCVVEDWVSPTETPPHMPTRINGRPPDAEEVAWALLMKARRRHKDALGEWAAEHGIQQRPAGAPVFRDRPAFLAHIARSWGPAKRT